MLLSSRAMLRWKKLGAWMSDDRILRLLKWLLLLIDVVASLETIAISNVGLLAKA